MIIKYLIFVYIVILHLKENNFLALFLRQFLCVSLTVLEFTLSFPEIELRLPALPSKCLTH